MIWLIGNKGMLGTEVEQQLKSLEANYSATDRDVDITSTAALNTYAAGIFKAAEQHWIINCSAYTAVDKAEDEPLVAAKINTGGVKNIAECAKQYSAKLIHISTDYVFDGKNPDPLTEELKTGPVSVYGKTKLAGETAIKTATNEYFIIRTAWLYGLYGSNFVYTMIKLMNARESLSVVNDQHGSPTNAKNLAGLITEIVNQNSNLYGVYHYTNEGNITWFDFASEIYRLGRKQGLITTECIINPCSSDKFPTKATRPEYSLLSKDKVKKTFGINVPYWKDSLIDFFNKIEEIK